MSSDAMSLETIDRPWWLLLIEGVAAIIVGAILLWGQLATKVEVWLLLVVLLGLYWLISGILTLVSMFQDHTAWGWKLFAGIISIIAGGYILVHPYISAAVLPQIFVLVLGIWGLMQGILFLVLAFKGGGWGMGILGAIAVVLGIVLIGNYGVPGAGLAFLWAAAIMALIGGVLLIVQAFRQRAA